MGPLWSNLFISTGEAPAFVRTRSGDALKYEKHTGHSAVQKAKQEPPLSRSERTSEGRQREWREAAKRVGESRLLSGLLWHPPVPQRPGTSARVLATPAPLVENQIRDRASMHSIHSMSAMLVEP